VDGLPLKHSMNKSNDAQVSLVLLFMEVKKDDVADLFSRKALRYCGASF